MQPTRPIPIRISTRPPRDEYPFDQPMGRSMEAVFEVPSPRGHGFHGFTQKAQRRDRRRQNSGGGSSKPSTKSVSGDKQQQQQQRKKNERISSQENQKRRQESSRYSNGVAEVDFVATRTQSFHLSEDQLSAYCINDDRLCMRQDLKDDFFGSEIPRAVTGFTVADLSFNQLTRFPVCFQLDYLKELSLSHNNLTEFVVTKPMPALVTVELQGNSIRSFPSVNTLSQLPKLRKLELYNNNIAVLPPEVCGLLSNLEELNLSFNKLEQLPSEIASLQKLRKLNLSYNFLTELPYQIRELHQLRRLELRNNDLRNPPQEWAKRGVAAIFNFFDRTYQSCSKMISQRKMIVLGDRNAGLLSVVEHLQDSGTGGPVIEAQSPTSLSGAVDEDAINLLIRDWSYSEQGVIKLWLLPTQFSEGQLPIFFGDDALYLLVWNIEQCESEKDVQRLVVAWVDLILAKVGRHCHIFMVPTNHEALTDAEISSRVLMVEQHLDSYLQDRARELDESRDGQSRYLANLKSPFTICSSIDDLRRQAEIILQPNNELVNIPQYILDVRNTCERMHNDGRLVATVEEIHDELGDDLTLQEVTYALSFLNRLGDHFVTWTEGTSDSYSDVDSLIRRGTPEPSHGRNGRLFLKHSNSSSVFDEFDLLDDDDTQKMDSADATTWTTPSSRRAYRKHVSSSSVDVPPAPPIADDSSFARAKSTGELWSRKAAATSSLSYADAARSANTPKLSRVDTPPASRIADVIVQTPLTESSVSRLGQRLFDISNYVFLNLDWFAAGMCNVMRRLRSLPKSGPKMKDGAIRGEDLATIIKKVAGDQPDIIWTLLERALVKFHFIVPVHVDNSQPASQDSSTPVPLSRDSSEGPWKTFHRFYIVPVYLPELQAVPIHRQLAMGEIMLEHQFHFGRYVPPDLVSLILAQSKQTHLSPMELDANINDDYYIALACENACWRNALKQFRTLPTSDNNYTSIGMWIVLEGNVLRVVGVGQLIRHKMILRSLEEYCNLVHNVLADLPGLYHVQEYTLCSKCLLEQRQHHKCGAFPWDTLAQDRAQRLALPGLSIQKHCGTCNLSINLEDLVYVDVPQLPGPSPSQPGDREELLAIIQQLEGATAFLLQECIRQQSVPVEQLQRSVCRVGVLTSSNVVEFRGSGAVFIDQHGRLMIATASHLFPDGAKPVGNPVVLGTEMHWVAIAFEPIRPQLAVLFAPTANGQSRSTDQQDWCFLVPNKLTEALRIEGRTTAADRTWRSKAGPVIPRRWQEVQEKMQSFPFVPLSAATEDYPQPEQFVRLLGFPGCFSLSSSCGRVVQPNANGLIIVDTYSDQGSSGGPLVGSDGQLFGVLSSSYTTQRFARVQPLLPALQVAEAALEKAHAYAQDRYQLFCRQQGV